MGKAGPSFAVIAKWSMSLFIASRIWASDIRFMSVSSSSCSTVGYMVLNPVSLVDTASLFSGLSWFSSGKRDGFHRFRADASLNSFYRFVLG